MLDSDGTDSRESCHWWKKQWIVERWATDSPCMLKKMKLLILCICEIGVTWYDPGIDDQSVSEELMTIIK